MNNGELYNLFTQTINNIFQNCQKFSNAQCQQLKNLIEKRIIGK